MSIPTQDFLVKPLTNSELRYDPKLHRYILQLDYSVHMTGLADLVEEVSTDGSNDNALWYLEWISHIAYEYIRSFKDAKFQKRLTYYLSHSRNAREALKTLMLDMLFYSMQEGGPFTAYVTGINLQEAQNITTINLKTVVGLLGNQIVKNYGLGEREFRHHFNFGLSEYGVDW